MITTEPRFQVFSLKRTMGENGCQEVTVSIIVIFMTFIGHYFELWGL